MGVKLVVQNLTVRKNRQTILEDVSFSVRPGEFVAIVGPNGAGKTTLLRALAGERPYAGHVLIEGEDLYECPERKLQAIGFVPVDNILHKELRVFNALTYVGRLRNIPSDELKEKIQDLLKEFGIPEKANVRISDLSSGERKRVNICAELLKEPGLLLLDEPTSNLDPFFENKLMELFANLTKKKGTTIVVVSHTTNSLQHCDRAIFLANSKVVQIIGNERDNGGPGEITTDDWVQLFGKHQTNRSQPISRLTIMERIRGLIFRAGTTVRQSQKRVFNTVRDCFEILKSWATSHWVEDISTIRVNQCSQYNIILSRQTKLLRWTLLLPLVLGLFAGGLLSIVLPIEALVESKGESISVEAGHVSQATFFIALVTFLIGLIGSYREVVRENDIYTHERSKGLDAKVYLLAKFTVFSTLYGIVAPAVVFLVVSVSQELPADGIILGGVGDVLITMFLTGMASVALGLALSSISRDLEKANAVMGAVVIAGALLARPPDNKFWKEIVNFLSVFTPSRWGMEGLQTTTRLYCWEGLVSWEIRSHYSLAHLTAVWLALVAHAMISLVIAYLALYYKDIWFTPVNRVKRLASSNTTIYILGFAFLVTLVRFPFYYLTVQSHEYTNNTGQMYIVPLQESRGWQGTVDRLGNLQCTVQTAPTRLEKPIDQAPLLPTASNGANVTPTNGSTLHTLNATTLPTFTSTVESQPAESETNSTPDVTPSTISTPTVAVSDNTRSAESSPASPVIDEPSVVVPDSLMLHFTPFSQSDVSVVTVPANSRLVLLSRTEAREDREWLRVRFIDDSGNMYTGWVDASNDPLANYTWQVNSERKAPPDCVYPLASTYRRMESVDIASGKLGTWTSDGSGEVAIVVDLFRTEAGSRSDELTLRILLNGQELSAIKIEPQQKQMILLNGVYNATVNEGDRLDLVLVPSSSNTLRTLTAHVSLFSVPTNCVFSG